MIKMRMANMMFYGFHGYYEYEREQGQKFFITVELTIDETSTNNPDELVEIANESAHAARVYDVVREFMENHRFQLMSSLGIKIADTLLEKISHVSEAKVSIRKPSVPISGYIDYVETEITRSRN